MIAKYPFQLSIYQVYKMLYPFNEEVILYLLIHNIHQELKVDINHQESNKGKILIILILFYIDKHTINFKEDLLMNIDSGRISRKPEKLINVRRIIN